MESITFSIDLAIFSQMSNAAPTDAEQMEEPKDIVKEHILTDVPCTDLKHMDQDVENTMPPHQEEEESIKKKFGGILPKKPPLISKDHERAFFDSADWALGKQGRSAEKSKGPLESLQPKLQPTHQQARLRRSAYAPPTDGEDGGNASSEDTNPNE